MRWVLSAGVAIVALVSACGDDSRSPTPSSSATATSAASATVSPAISASPSPTPNPNLITRGPDIDFPADTAMIIESGCWGCDSGPGDLFRVYRDALGKLRKEDLLASVQASLPQATFDTPNGPVVGPLSLSGHAMTQDASVIAVSFCTKGTCLGLGENDPNSEGVALRSFDGGITWQEIGRGGPAFLVEGALSDGHILVYEEAGTEVPGHYLLLPDNTALTPPEDGLQPIVSANQILWLNASGGPLLRSDGSVAFTPPQSVDTYFLQVLGSLDNTKSSALMDWTLPMPGSDGRPPGYIDRYVIAEIGSSNGDAQIAGQWEIDGYLWRIGWWSAKDNRAVVTFASEDGSGGATTPFPTIVDLKTKTYNMIVSPFATEPYGTSSLGRTTVHAVQTGPFARVTGTGSCLNIRADASASGAVLACMADGVLLHDNGETRVTSEGMWESVMTPNGTQGWASAAFLEPKPG